MNKKNKRNIEKTGLAENKDGFPPRGSSINIPNEVLYNSSEKVLNNIVDNKSKKIDSDLYKGKK